MSSGGFQHPGRAVQSGDTEVKCQEDGRNGLTSLSGSRHPVRGGLRAADYGRRNIIPVRVQYLECGEDMALNLLAVHQQTHHRKAAGGRWHWGTTDPGGEPQTYKMAFPTTVIPRNCPIEGFWRWTVAHTAMQVHFLHRHVKFTMIILREGNLPHPRCTRCDMLVPCKALNRRHINTAQCDKGAERKRQRLSGKEM